MTNAVWGSFGFCGLGLLLAACGGTTAPMEGSAGSANTAGSANVAGDTSVAGSSNIAGMPGAAGAGSAGSAGAATYSPESCQTAGGVPVASTGGKQTPEDDCPSGVALGVIDAASSGWDEGGLCCEAVPANEVCGGILGNPCAAGEFCAYKAGSLCGAADASSVCKPRPTQCTDLYAPVCGCDEKTYDNSCLANAAGTGIMSAGSCSIK